MSLFTLGHAQDQVAFLVIMLRIFSVSEGSFLTHKSSRSRAVLTLCWVVFLIACGACNTADCECI